MVNRQASVAPKLLLTPTEVDTMDGFRFDALTRSVMGTAPSRRGALRLLTGTALGCLLAGEVEPSAAKRKKRVTLCLNGQTLKVSKKKKKAYIARGATPGACRPGTDRCPSEQKTCDGGCIPASQCCNSADCTVFGQTCSSARQCVCPQALPEVCGGACLAPCLSNQQRNPQCQCCFRNGEQDAGNYTNCCSRRSVSGTCTGRDPGSACTFHAECGSLNCVQGVCSSCPSNADVCLDGGTCGSGGGCLKAVDGTTRCGSRISSIECGMCSDDSACDQGQGLGYFCAKSTGGSCTCPAGQTYCARPR